MHAVRVEGGEGHLGGLRTAQVKPRFLVAMADQEGSARINCRQHENEGGEHTSGLLGIAMAHKETARVVHQEFVEISHDRPGDPEACGRPRHNVRQGLRPVPAADLDPRGVDLPGPPHCSVDQGGVAPAGGGLLGDGKELLGLDGQQWQGNGANACHVQAWCKDIDCTAGIKITGTLHRLQDLGQLGGERCHALPSFRVLECHEASDSSAVLPLAQARGCQDRRRLTSPCAKAVPLVRGSNAMV
jgi:hypothetical protein